MNSNNHNHQIQINPNDQAQNELNDIWKQIAEQDEKQSDKVNDDSNLQTKDQVNLEQQKDANNNLQKQNESKQFEGSVNTNKSNKKRANYQSPNVKKTRIQFTNLFKSSQKNQNKSQIRDTSANQDKIKIETNNIIKLQDQIKSGQENEENKDEENLEVNLMKLENFIDLQEQNKSLLEYRQYKYTDSDKSSSGNKQQMTNIDEIDKNQNFTEIEYNLTAGNCVLTTGQQTIKNTNNLLCNTQIGGDQDDFFKLKAESLRTKRKTQQMVKKQKKNQKIETQKEGQDQMKQKNALGFFSKFLPNWQIKKKDKNIKIQQKQLNSNEDNDETLQIHQNNFIRNNQKEFQIIENYINEGDENNPKQTVSNQEDNLSTKLFVDQASQIGQFVQQNNKKNDQICNKNKNFGDDNLELQYQGFGEILYNSSDSELDDCNDKKFSFLKRESGDMQSRFSLVAMRKQKQSKNFGGTFQIDSHDNEKKGQQESMQSQFRQIGSPNSNNIQNTERKVSNVTNHKSQNSNIQSNQGVIQEKQAIFKGIHKNKVSSEYYEEFQNDGDLPINLDFLNYQEQQIVDNIFPIKKKSDNSNNSIIKSINQISQSKSNFDSEVVFNNSLPTNILEKCQQDFKQTFNQHVDINNQEQNQFSQFQGIKVQQQGTSISIFNVYDSEQKQQIINILNSKQIVPSRVIYLQEAGEIILNMISFEETSQAIKFFIENKVKIINNQMVEEVVINNGNQANLNDNIFQNNEKQDEERDQVYEISLYKKIKYQNEINENMNQNQNDQISPEKCMIQSFNSIYSNQMQMKNPLFDSGTFDENHRKVKMQNELIEKDQQYSQQNIKQSSFYPFGLLESHDFNQKAQRTISQQGIQLDNNFQVKIGDFSEKNQSYFDFVKAKFQQERFNRINNDKNQIVDEDQIQSEFEQKFQNNDSFDPRGLFQNMSSNYANYEGLMSQSQINFVYENSLNPKTIQKLGKPQSFADSKLKKNIGNKSADYQQSSKIESVIDSESSEKFSYIQPLYQQMDSFSANKMFTVPNIEMYKQRYDVQDKFGDFQQQNNVFNQQLNWKHENIHQGMKQNQQYGLQAFQLQQQYYQRQMGNFEDSADYEQQLMNYYLKQCGRNINEKTKQEQIMYQMPQQYQDINQQQIQQKNQMLLQQQMQQASFNKMENEKSNQINKINLKQANSQQILPQNENQSQPESNNIQKIQEISQAESQNNKDQKSLDEKQKNRSVSPGQQKKPAVSNYKKKVYIGPKQNKIDFDRILNADFNNDQEVKQQTTLMIRNIPIKFNQQDMMQLIDKNFKGQYDYFYLPIDLKTQCGMGFAFINMLHSIFILEFYLEFNCVKWSEKIEKCNSNKHSQITYANVQGINDIKAELLDKNIMKKADGQNKPQFFEDQQIDYTKINEIKYRYQYDHKSILYYQQKLKEFEEQNNNDNQKQKQVKNERVIQEEQKSDHDNSQNEQIHKKQKKELISKNQKMNDDYLIEENQEQKYGYRKTFQHKHENQNPRFMHQQQNFNREIYFQQENFRNKSANKHHINNEIQYSNRQYQQVKYEDKYKGKNIKTQQQILIQKTFLKCDQPQTQQQYKAFNMGQMVKGKNYFYNPITSTKKYRESMINFQFQLINQLEVLDDDGKQIKHNTPTFAQYKEQGNVQKRLAEIFKSQNQYLHQINESSKISTGITPIQAVRQPSSIMETIFNKGKYF